MSGELEANGAVLIRKRSDGERGKVGGSWFWGLRIIWKVAKDNGEMSPVGGLTRNLCGDEVWILKATGIVEQSDLKRTVARHLQLSKKSMRTSGSNTSTNLSIVGVYRVEIRE